MPEGCWLAPIIEGILADRVHGEGLRKCGGEIDPHHVVEKQRIKEQHRRWVLNRSLLGWEPPVALETLLKDPRNIVPVCRDHHNLLTNRAIRLGWEDLPESVKEFAEQYGFDFDLERGWRVLA